MPEGPAAAPRLVDIRQEWPHERPQHSTLPVGKAVSSLDLSTLSEWRGFPGPELLLPDLPGGRQFANLHQRCGFV